MAGEEDVIQSERISIAPMEMRYHPQIRSRGGMLVKTSLGDNKGERGGTLGAVSAGAARFDGYERRACFGGGGISMVRRIPITSPLRQMAVVQRSSKHDNTKLCASNPKVWQQWLEGRFTSSPS